MSSPVRLLTVFWVLASSCQLASVEILPWGDSASGQGGGGSGSPEDSGPPPPPEEIAFQEVDGGWGGPAFRIDGEAYFVYGTNVVHVVDPFDHNTQEIAADSGAENGINCVSSFNVEVLNGKGYIMGGMFGSDENCDKPDGASDEVWEFDPQAGTVVRVASMNHVREVMASGSANDRIWVLGGWTPIDNPDGLNEASVEMFDGQRWTEVAYTGQYSEMRSAAYATVGDEIYLFGGCLSTWDPAQGCVCSSQLVQVFDTTTRSFSQRQPMPLAGRHFSGQHAVDRGQYIYVFGGATDFSCCVFDDVGRYDTVTDTWKLLTDHLVVERKGTGALVHGDYLYVYGGLKAVSEEQCPDDGSCPENCGIAGVGTNEIGTFITDTGAE